MLVARCSSSESSGWRLCRSWLIVRLNTEVTQRLYIIRYIIKRNMPTRHKSHKHSSLVPRRTGLGGG